MKTVNLLSSLFALGSVVAMAADGPTPDLVKINKISSDMVHEVVQGDSRILGASVIIDPKVTHFENNQMGLLAKLDLATSAWDAGHPTKFTAAVKVDGHLARPDLVGLTGQMSLKTAVLPLIRYVFGYLTQNGPNGPQEDLPLYESARKFVDIQDFDSLPDLTVEFFKTAVARYGKIEMLRKMRIQTQRTPEHVQSVSFSVATKDYPMVALKAVVTPAGVSIKLGVTIKSDPEQIAQTTQTTMSELVKVQNADEHELASYKSTVQGFIEMGKSIVLGQ